MDFVEATQVLRDEAPSNNARDEAQVGTLKIGSQTHIIRRGFNRIGRSPQCPVVINDVTVSKVHAEIQAGAEAAFVSDLRSSNGTKIKDVPIKPFYYYSINDGDAIYFGQVKAVYSTARSTETEDVLLVPETPVASRNRNATERFSAGAGNISESFLNNSSVYESDISMIPGTQETERKRPTFQKPSTPVQRSPSTRKVEAVSKTNIDETATRNDIEATFQPPGAKRPRLEERNDPSNESNIHEAETQAMPSPIAKRKEASQPRHSDDIFEAETQVLPAAMAEKRKNRDDIFEAETQISQISISEKRKNRDDIFEAETQVLPAAMAEKRKNRDDIFEAETQALPIAMAKKKNFEDRRNRDDIFEAETQALPVAMSDKKNFEKQKNRDDIFEAETQALPVAMSEKKIFGARKNRDDIFEAETQALPVAMSEKKIFEARKNRDDIFEAETQALPVAMGKKKKIEDIFEAETQAMEVSTSDSRGSVFEAETQATEITTSGEPNSIFEAETQAMEISVPKSGEKIAKRSGGKILREINRTSSGRENNNIHEAETQMAQVQLASSEPMGMQENIHDLATQILDKNRSSAGGSVGRLNETVESSYRSNSSRDRLRLSSTPPSSPESVDVEESQNLLEIVETPLLAYEKSCEKISSPEDVPVAVEEPKIGEKKSRVFRRVRTIPESSESETDDEKVSPRFVRRSKPSNVIEDSSEEPTDEENVFGGSPLARGNEKGASTRDAGPAAAKGRPEASEARSLPLRRRESDERDSDGGEKKDVSMPGDSPTVPSRGKDGISWTEVEGKLARGRGDSGDSPTVPSRGKDGISRTEVEGRLARGRGDSGDSPTSPSRGKDGISRTEVEGRLARGRGESGDSPTVPSRGNDGISRTEVEGRLARGRGESGDSPTGLAPSDALSSKKIGETSTGKSGCSSVRLLGRKDGDSPKKNREAPEGAGAKANLLGDSPSGDENSPKKIEAASTTKFGRSPLRLPRKADRDSPKKNDQRASGRGGAKSNLFGDSPKKDNGSASKNPAESPEAAKNSEKIGNSPKNQGESPEGAKNSKKFGDSPGRTNDSPGKIQAEKSSKFQSRSNIFGRPSLRLPRKADDPSPKRTNEKSAKEEDDDIFAAATQRVVYDSVGNAPTAREVDQREGPAARNDELDIDLLPTQILDIPSLTPLSRKSRHRKNRVGEEQLDGEDLHSAPTQILKESPRSENTDDHEQPHGKDLHGTPTRMLRKSPRRGKVDADRDKTKNAAKTIDLDDSLATHLGNILGEEANNDCLDDEGTQLMTQNLVDILRPTQSFSEDTGNRKSSPRTSAENFGQGPSSPARKKIYAPGTLGFVDGEARNSSRELVSADPSPIKAARENKEIAAPSAINDEPEASAHLADDDIFFGLPEVRICGTLSNPGSPSSSISSLGDFPPSKKRSRKSATNFGPTNRADSPDSPITPKKSRVTKRSTSSYKILEDALDDDSDEDFDYQDLKRMADRLLASESRCEGKSRRTTTRPSDVDKFAKIPVPIVRKKIGAPKRRAVKLSGGPSSSPVSDVKDETSSVGSADSSTETRKSRRRRKPAASVATTIVAVSVPLHSKKEQGGEESQEVEAILGNAVEDNRPMVSRKSYAKLKMAKRNVEDKNVDAVAKTPKATRTRRTVSVARKVQETPVVTPSRVRRTIAGPPGIPGDDEDRKILFTGVRDDKYDRIVEKLGGTVVSDPSEATVLITDKVRRTFKFLCAVARGIRVVSINWLLESSKASRFLDCERFVLKEAAAEAKYKFTLEKSLRIARTKKLLDGYTIIVTPKVNQPEIHELKGMVEACGGRLLVRPGRNWSAKTVIISREEDYAVAKSYLAKAPKNLKITVQTTEFILTGILRQEINLVEHELKFE